MDSGLPNTFDKALRLDEARFVRNAQVDSYNSPMRGINYLHCARSVRDQELGMIESLFWDLAVVR